MTRTAMFFATLAIAAGTMLAALPAQAQPPRVFVSGSGNDSNACTYAAPCRTFAQAFSVVAPNGEIDVLDPAGYGPLTVTGPVSIQGHGYASITQTAGCGTGTAITVSAGTSDTILLNGLLIDGVGSGCFGIWVKSAGSVQIVDCVIRHFDTDLYFYPSNAAILSVSNTIVSDSFGDAYGININTQPSSSPLVTLDGVTATGNGTGVGFYGSQVVTLTNSNVSDNSGDGVDVGGGGQAIVKTSVVANNGGTGVNAYAGTTWLARNAIYGNAAGVNQNGGTINSFGDNDFANNNGMDVVNGPLGTATTE